MFRAVAKFVVFFVGIHLVLALTMIIYRMVCGRWVNDQEPIFLVNLIVYYMNRLSVRLLEWLEPPGGHPGWIAIFLVGTVQWTIVGCISGSIYHWADRISLRKHRG